MEEEARNDVLTMFDRWFDRMMKLDREDRMSEEDEYTEEQREGLRTAGRFNAELMDLVRARIGPGVTTLELDELVYEYTMDHGHTPATLGYRGDKHPFPASCCTSVNNVICHGIPGEYRLQEGDIVVSGLYRLEFMPGAQFECLLEVDGILQFEWRHHLLHVFDHGVDDETFER